jgi:molybdopterin-guanine dinucleotide biosynthesis protein A
MTDDAPLGIILAGGLARRMGGGDKTLRLLAGRPILARVIERLAPQCSALLLSANGDPDRFAPFGLPVLADSVPDFAGPLAGILAGLDHIAQTKPGADRAVSVAADCPFLPHDLVQRLDDARRRGGAELAVACSPGRTHPVIGLWPVSLRDSLRQALAADGLRKIDLFTARHRLAEAVWPATPIDPFFNANTPEDIAEAEAFLTRHGEP